jgi:mRNA-degrading endonuclease toxin of MazEF toxin-antitoxin module
VGVVKGIRDVNELGRATRSDVTAVKALRKAYARKVRAEALLRKLGRDSVVALDKVRDLRAFLGGGEG